MQPVDINYIEKFAEGGLLSRIKSAFSSFFGGGSASKVKVPTKTNVPTGQSTDIGQIRSASKSRVLSPAEIGALQHRSDNALKRIRMSKGPAKTPEQLRRRLNADRFRGGRNVR